MQLNPFPFVSIVELFQHVDEISKNCAHWNVISSRIEMCTPFLNKSILHVKNFVDYHHYYISYVCFTWLQKYNRIMC
jgi:hypothetical protein